MAKDSREPPHHGGETRRETVAPTPAQATPPRLEGVEMSDQMRQQQAQASQQPPKPVKLDPARDEIGQPRDAPPVPPKAAAEPVPRVIDQSERSPDPQKYTRFKLRADEPFGVQPTRYVLANRGDKQGAIKHYLETTGLQSVLDTFPEGQAPRPRMSVRELPD